MEQTFLTYEQQVALLKSKGLGIADETMAKETLEHIGYFPLIGRYKHPFKNKTTNKYKENVDFSDILSLYEFDNVLRQIMFHYLLMVEKDIKNKIAYYFSLSYGANQEQYLQVANYSTAECDVYGVERLIDMLSSLALHPSKHAYIKHHQDKYHNVPLWVLINGITFGTTSKMFGYLPQSVQSKICKHFPLHGKQVKSILEVLTKYRNICAHGELLFSYRTHDDIPDLPLHKKMGIPQKGTQYLYGKKDLFSVLIALRYMLPSLKFNEMKRAIVRLIGSFLSVCTVIDESQLLLLMGFPENWKKINLYK